MKPKLLMIICAIAVAYPACNRAPVPLQGVIEVLTGAVTITENGVTKHAKAGDVVRKDAMVTTGEASFVQVAINGSMIQVYEKSSIILSGLVRGGSGAEEMTVRVGEGTIFSRVKKMLTDRGDSFSVQSCTMVAAVRGTEFLYAVDCSKGMVATFEGVVGVRKTGDREEAMVPAGQMITVEAGKGSTTSPIPKNFRYRDFVYTKQGAAADEASGAVMESAGGARGKGTKDQSAEKTVPTSPEKKSTDKTVVRKKESGNGAGETAPAAKKSESGGTRGGTMTPAGSKVKPGGLLDKPRMNLPELK